MPNLSLGVAGMHGQIGVGITPRHAANFASAVGSYLEGGRVVIGCDTRYSTPVLRHAVMAALIGCGCEVIDAGIAPAPAVQYLTRELGADGALLIGGAHHAAGWNSLVPVGANGAVFNPVQMQSLLDLYHSGRFRQVRYDALGATTPAPADWQDGYLAAILAPFDVAAIHAAGYTVVGDFTNGAGGELCARLMERLGVKLIAINDNRIGVLPHDPEPRPRASVQVQALIRPLAADLGFVVNSDMTRVALVTCSAETLSEEHTYPIVADQILARRGNPGTVVVNVCSSSALDHVVRLHDGELLRTKVGQCHVVDSLHEASACLGGEGCGSVVFPAVGPWYDAYGSLITVLEAMAQRGVTSSALRARLLRRHIVKRKIPCANSRGYSLVHRLHDAFPDADRDETDGLRFDFQEGWVHLRVSSTEPAVRLIVEWVDVEGAQAMATRVRALIERQNVG